MVALGMAGLAIGLVLARRFTAFALLPVELAALLVAMGIAMIGHGGWLSPLLGFLSFWLSSQTGYAVTLAIPALLRSRARRWV